MTPVALYSPVPARGWLPWAWLTPILMILFNAVPVIALDGWMQSQHWSTPRGDPVGLAGLYALVWIGFAPTLAAVLAWVRFVEGRSLASIGLTGPAPMKTFLRGLAIGFGTIALVVLAIWMAGGLQAAGLGPAWRSPVSLLHIRVIATTAAVVSAASDWTCRVLVANLDPAGEYWYRFVDEEGNGSRVGRTLTAPTPEDPRPSSFAFVSCQCLPAFTAFVTAG